MRRLQIALTTLALAAGCSGDDGSNGSMGSGGTDSTTDSCPRGIGGSGDQCPITDTVTDSQGTMSSSSGGTMSDTEATGPTTSTSGTASTTSTSSATDASATGMTTGMTMTATDTGSMCADGCELESTFMVTLDMCGHESFVDLGPTETVRITINGDMITLEILGMPGLDPVVGTIDMAGAFSAMGTGTVAGYPDIEVSWTGTYVGGALSATLELGGGGGLPGECPILYSVMD